MYKILAIDDDVAMTELLTLVLKTYMLDAHMANTGEDGIRMAQELSPDVVILDLMMPGMDGWEVCSRIRSFSNVPILILSALDHPGMVAKALDAGADDYLVKPAPSSVLVAHLNTLTRRAVAGKKNPNQVLVHTTPLSV
jgi:DNA-binding response OmpR family regulator